MVLYKKIVIFALLIPVATISYCSDTGWSFWCCRGDNDVEAFSNQTATPSPAASPVSSEAPALSGDDRASSTSSQAENTFAGIMNQRFAWFCEADTPEAFGQSVQTMVPAAVALAAAEPRTLRRSRSDAASTLLSRGLNTSQVSFDSTENRNLALLRASAAAEALAFAEFLPDSLFVPGDDQSSFGLTGRPVSASDACVSGHQYPDARRSQTSAARSMSLRAVMD